ncbi:MAG: type 1 glutamine amidotransferase [Deltaproteobacteria bacterium]|nr:type 1 glutamine amidotransferase [Deltaproteobacteria bacterium]
MSRVLVLQHVKSEGLGIISKSLKQKKVGANFIKIFNGERIPRGINGYDGLVVLGGPMGVYEEEIYPFIKDEITLIKNALKNNVPVLGICLGAQFLAKAAGADVYKGKKKEIGWYTVELTDDGKSDGLFIGLPDEFTVFQWHGDTWGQISNLSPAKCLASSELFPHQIIKVGKNAYGLQFHLEVTEEMIKEWIDVNDKEMASVKAYINPKKILKDTSRNIKTIHIYGEAVFSRFLNLVYK